MYEKSICIAHTYTYAYFQTGLTYILQEPKMMLIMLSYFIFAFFDIMPLNLAIVLAAFITMTQHVFFGYFPYNIFLADSVSQLHFLANSQ